MTWSHEQDRLEITDCDPKGGQAGREVTVAIAGHNRGAHRDTGEAWFALLVPIEESRDLEAEPPTLRASTVRYTHGAGDRFAVTARFELPPQSVGRYQFVLGRDDADAMGEHARFLVDADDFDGAFVIA